MRGLSCELPTIGGYLISIGNCMRASKIKDKYHLSFQKLLKLPKL